MSKSKTSSIGIGGIIFWIFIGYLIFGGDDKDSKQIDVEVDNNKTVATEEIKKHASNIKDNVKLMIEVAKEAVEDKLEESKKEDVAKVEEEEIIEEKIEEEKEEKEQPEIKPLFEDDKITGDMKKL